MTALEGIRVLDLTRLLPGGFCSLLLADFGADVVKVEDTGMGDYLRWTPPHYDGADPTAGGAMFLQRYVIIVGTAFAGSMTILLGCIEVLATRAVQTTTAARPVWILYPMAVFDGPRWMPIAWALLGFAGTAVQLGVTGRKKKTSAKR